MAVGVEQVFAGTLPIADIRHLRHVNLMRTLSFTLAIAAVLSPVTVSAAPDARAQDAADAFSQLCVSMFIGGKSGADHQRFEVTRLDDATRRQIKPNIKASTLWDVRGKASDASMLMHYEPEGLCVVEMAEADEASMQSAVAKVASDAAISLNKTATEQEKLTRLVQGMTATTSSWRFPSDKGGVLVMLTTLPEAKFMIQHVITVSYVR